MSRTSGATTPGTGRRGRRLPVLDPLDPAVQADPYPTYQRLRAAGPLCRVAPASWGVTRHAHVAALLRDPRLANQLPDGDAQLRPATASDHDDGDDPAGAAATAPVLERLMPAQPGGDHDLLHRAMARAFSPGTARGRGTRIAALVRDRLAAARDTGQLEVVGELAFPVTVTVVSELMGVPVEVGLSVLPGLSQLSEAFTPFLPSSSPGGPERALAELRATVAALLAERRRRPESDLLTELLRLAAATSLTDADVVDNICFLLFTGFETTMNMIASGCVALCAFPDQQDLLRERPQLAARAVEEFLRWDPPIQYTARLATEPISLDGHLLRPGRPVFLLLGSANRDESVFRDPDRVDVTREPNPHVGFGGGVRGCIGVALARVEGAAVFTELHRAFASMEAVAAPQRHPNPLFRHHTRVPLSVRPR